MLENENNDHVIYKFGKKISFWFLALAILGFLILLLPLVLPIKYNYDNLSSIGNTVGGFLNPLIAIAAALLTFLAFYVQYKSNRQQINSIEQQLVANRQQAEANIQQSIAFEQQKKDIATQRFENIFFEMLKLHKENVKEMNITGYYKSIEITTEHNEEDKQKPKLTKTEKQVDKIITGRKVFVSMINELIFCCDFCVEFNNVNDKKYRKETMLKLGYRIFFNGYNTDLLNTTECKGNFIKLIQKELRAINKNHRNSKGESNSIEVNRKKLNLNIKYSPFLGHVSRLGHYYRHLFYIVKYVVENEQKGMFDYRKSREYLKLLRAQLSNDEQLLLYYNFKIGFGKDWETDKNKFLSKYRMIHNLPLGIVKYNSPHVVFKNQIKQINLETKGEETMFEWGDN